MALLAGGGGCWRKSRWSGWGGSFGCGDAAIGIAIGYACNHMEPDLVGDPRASALCRAIFDVG